MRLPLRLALALGLSGFAAVLYEVLWVRILGDLFGHTAFAIQVVLTSPAWPWEAGFQPPGQGASPLRASMRRWSWR